MQEIVGINHIGLRVKSLEVARSFYGQLGFMFIAGPIGPEPVAIMIHPSGINLNLILNASEKSTENILMDHPDKYPGYTHVALEIRGLNSVLELLEDKNIPLTEGPVSFPGGTSIFIRDPDQNVIEFHEPDLNG